MKRHTLIPGIALAAFAALPLAGLAHGDAKPMYGGVVQVVSDMQYELVPQSTGAALYVVDHGKPADASRLSGKLTVLQGTQKTEAELKPAGGNKLEAAGLKLAPGARVVAVLRRPDGKSVSVRFVLKS